MIEHVFSPEMMQERERQLILALLDCAGVYYDVNFTENRILGNPIQIVDNVPYSILQLIGKTANCTYTEIIDYWYEKMPLDERDPFMEFSRIERIKDCYATGERVISHKFWTYDVLGNSMLAEQKIRLYQDHTNGDLLGLVYVSNGKNQDAWEKREAKLFEDYERVSNEAALLESMGANVPSGYHRCGTGEGFPLLFVSDSFLEAVGWTKEELETELDNKFINVVAPEDRDFFMSHESELIKNGRVSLAYRILRKDGTRRWIQDSTTKLEKNGEVFYQCTLADIDDYVQKLNAEKTRAEASNQAKSTFLFNASHDIRTPMNAIQGFAHIIEKNADNPQIVRETVRKIQQSSDMLMTLINDILELSRIERGKEEVNCRPLDMKAHVDKLYEMFLPEMEQSGIEFRMMNSILHPAVLGDDLKLTRIAMNLLSNARKFTPAGGTVTFGVRESNYNGSTASYTLFVKDTGIGMSREFQERAFEQFERERSATDSGVSGSGLGLAIIKRLTDLMHGRCTINSELGKGTEVIVETTLELMQEEFQQDDPVLQNMDFTGKCVLLVEDNEFNREIARYVLESMKLTVEEAENGSVCLDKLFRAEEGQYDLILMDIQMPIMDGYTATKEIRNMENPKIASIPILAMTANAFEEDKKRCLEIGMNGHIGKPFEAETLIRELSSVLR